MTGEQDRDQLRALEDGPHELLQRLRVPPAAPLLEVEDVLELIEEDDGALAVGFRNPLRELQRVAQVSPRIPIRERRFPGYLHLGSELVGQIARDPDRRGRLLAEVCDSMPGTLERRAV